MNTNRRGVNAGLLSDTSWALGGNVISIGLSLASFVVVGKGLGAEGFGKYAALYAVAAPLGAFSFSGLVLAVMQHITREGEDARRVAASAMSLTLALGALAVLVGVATAPFVIDDLALLLVAGFLVAELLLYPTVLIAAATVQCIVGLREATVARIVPPVLRTSLLVMLFVVGHMSLTGIVVAALVGYTVSCTGALWWCGKRLRFRLRPGATELAHLKSGLLFSSSSVANGFISSGDKLVLSSTGTPAELGIYAAAYRVLGFMSMPLDSIIASSHLRFLHHDEQESGQHVRRAARYGAVAVAYGILATGAVFVAAPLLTFVLGDQFRDSQDLLRRLMPLLLLSGPTSFALNGLLGLGKNAFRSAMLFIVALLSMVVYLVLIPRHGLDGAIVATYIIETVMLVAAWVSLLVFERRYDRCAIIRGGNNEA